MRTLIATCCFVAPIMLAALLSGCGESKTQEQKVQKVRVETVASAGEEEMVQYPGKVKAAHDVSLSFRVSGVIERYCVEEGRRVGKGQLLVELDPTDYQVQLDATEAEYQQVKAEAERVMALYGDSVATPNDNDRAVYGLRQITAKRQHHQDELAYTKLYAPFDGTVQKHLLEEHETVGAGMPVVSMVSSGEPEVEINLPASEYVDRDLFARFSCTFNTYPGETYDMTLISITPKANSNQLYTMRLQLQTAGKQRPSPGMNTMVTIGKRPSEGDNRLRVSGSSVLSKDGKQYVYLYSGETATVTRKEATVCEVLSDGSCLVVADGVNPGDKIVCSGVRAVDDGEKVELLEETSSTNVGGLL